MSPEKARVFIAEDNDDWQEMIKRLLEKKGHTVIAQARTYPDAVAQIERFREHEVDVAILDGNLDTSTTSGRDGQSLLASIRKLLPNVKTVGMSGSSVPGTDVDLGKRHVEDIGDVVTNL